LKLAALVLIAAFVALAFFGASPQVADMVPPTMG